MSEHDRTTEPTPDPGTATAPDERSTTPAEPARRGDPPRTRPAEPTRSGRRRPGRWAGSLATGVVVVVAVAAGVVVGRFLLPPGGDEDGALRAGESSPAAGVATVWTCSMHPQIRQPKPGKCPSAAWI